MLGGEEEAKFQRASRSEAERVRAGENSAKLFTSTNSAIQQLRARLLPQSPLPHAALLVTYFYPAGDGSIQLALPSSRPAASYESKCNPSCRLSVCATRVSAVRSYRQSPGRSALPRLRHVWATPRTPSGRDDCNASRIIEKLSWFPPTPRPYRIADSILHPNRSNGYRLKLGVTPERYIELYWRIPVFSLS